MCAGSLMSGCSFDVTCFSIHGELGRGCCQIWCPKRVIWHACCAQFGTLGTIERCRGTWEHTEGDLGGPGLDFYRFWKDFGAAIWTFLANFGTTIVFFGMRVCRSRFLKILGSESGCLGLQNQAFGVEGIAKTSFSHMSGLCRFWCHFYMVFDGFGTNFDDFWWLGGMLETS
jgi:hypothetical protein